jgi:hypothetical protein
MKCNCCNLSLSFVIKSATFTYECNYCESRIKARLWSNYLSQYLGVRNV